MRKMTSSLKDIISKVPYPIGKFLTKIPFDYRLGKEYTVFKKMIEESMNWSDDQKYSYIITHLKEIKNWAQASFDFYGKLYAQHGVADLTIKDLSDWQKIPVVEKE